MSINKSSYFSEGFNIVFFSFHRLQELFSDDLHEAGRIPRTIDCELTCDLGIKLYIFSLPEFSIVLFCSINFVADAKYAIKLRFCMRNVMLLCSSENKDLMTDIAVDVLNVTVLMPKNVVYCLLFDLEFMEIALTVIKAVSWNETAVLVCCGFSDSLFSATKADRRSSVIANNLSNKLCKFPTLSHACVVAFERCCQQ